MTNEMIQQFPSKRMKAMDGLTVTADVWEEAHGFHREQLRFHALLAHGAGIVSGLNVIAGDPPDSSVFVQPGVALDPQGHAIVLSEPMSYDVGHNMDGLLHVLLSYSEGAARPGNGSGDGPLYVEAQFSIVATPTLPATPFVELARVRRVGRQAAITDAKEREHPRANELDLRFRREIGGRVSPTVSVGVVHLGAHTERHGNGAKQLARALNRQGGQRVILDDALNMDAQVNDYTLLYLVGGDDFQMSADQMTVLYNYLQQGGTVFYEACRHDAKGEPKADAAFMDLLGSFGAKLTELAAGHDLLNSAALFAAPPAGFESQGTPKLMVGDGIIFSTHDYGCLWQGERRAETPSRESIRSAMEWGANLIAYAAARRKPASARS